jgi:DNA topoisomerase-1
MAKNLVIVESPAKAKTIEGYLGSDYLVKSSFGHIRDLSKDNDAVDLANDYKPRYEIPSDKKDTVTSLKKLAKEAETVWLATDEDREGEAISWHLAEVLKLDIATTKRIVFHEITKSAILKAIDKPRTIDMNLVDAQQARRILDRLVGFELSPVLWKKVKPSLSAGRVQSVAVRLIVEREREILNFESSFDYKVVALFDVVDDHGKTKHLKAELPKKYKQRDDAEAFLKSCINAKYTIAKIEKKPAKRSAAPPFTTSTLQQEASRKLGYGVASTMIVAQKLYEAGHITYMRTDSVNLSETALNAAQQEIERNYGKDFSKPRQYTTKSSGAQEAHEAIRPTNFSNHEIEGDSQAKKLYSLIWKRAIASQMSDAEFERTIVDIDISTNKQTLVAQGEVLKFEGFLKVYLESTDEEGDEEAAGMLPPLNVGQFLDLDTMTATQRFAKPAARFTEASLVKKLEENGIGRPSTYAPTISTVQKRGYVLKEDRDGKQREFEIYTLKKNQVTSEKKTENYGAEKSKLFPSDIGSVVTDFLIKHFSDIMDYRFTASVEAEFDEIALGKVKWQKMIDGFYKPFHEIVEKTSENAERQKGERELGIDPKSGKKVIARIGRYGPLVQIGGEAAEGEEKPQFANLRTGQMIESITLEEALELFKLPRVVGTYEEKEIKANTGRFGPYIQHNSKFISIPKGEDPMTIDEPRAIQLIEEKRKVESERLIKAFTENPDVQLLNGRWGPYLAIGKNNYKLVKGTDPLTISLDECLKLAAEQDAAPKKPGKGKWAKKK